jgi:predicted metalloprotease
MRWKGRKQSTHIEDRRGETMRAGGGSMKGGAIGGLLFTLFRRGSAKTKVILVIGVIIGCMVFHINPLSLFFSSPSGGNYVSQTSSSGKTPPDPEMKNYIATMQGDNDTIWTEILAKEGKSYTPPKVVIYSGRTHTAGGVADAQMGPFYMSADKTIYIDPSFFQELHDKFGAKGDFAQAYVLAHENGHHIQDLLGILDQMHRKQRGVSKEEANRLSVRLELQADFFAGVFSHHAQKRFKFLEPGDLEEALNCAKQIGDDRLQKMSGRPVRPDHFTHGTSKQRQRWFKRGFESGKLSDGDTFNHPYQSL